MNADTNLYNITQKKKSIVLSQQGNHSNVYKYLGGDSIIYRNHYIQNQNNLDYYGHIYEINHTMFIHSEEIVLYDKVNISGNLSVVGFSTFNNNVFINGNLNISGNIIGSSMTFSIPNNLFITGNLIVSGNSTFSNNLSTSGLYVSNNAKIDGCLSVSCLNVSNSLNINGNLIVSGNSTFISNLSTSGLYVSNNVLINGNLIVSGSVSYTNLIPTILNATFINKINATYTVDNAKQNLYSLYIIPPKSNYKIRLMSTLQLYTNNNDNTTPFSATITRTNASETINLANRLNINTGDITYTGDVSPYNNPTNLDTSLGCMYLSVKQHSYMLSMMAFDEPNTTSGITYSIRVQGAHSPITLRNGTLSIDYIIP